MRLDREGAASPSSVVDRRPSAPVAREWGITCRSDWSMLRRMGLDPATRSRVPVAIPRGRSLRAAVFAAGGRSIRRGVVRDLLLVGNVVLVGLFLMARAGSAYSPLWDGWIGNLVMVVPVIACFAQATRSGPRRVAALWLGVGMLCWAAGT